MSSEHPKIRFGFQRDGGPVSHQNSEKGERYTVSAAMINTLVGVMLAGLASIGAYMVSWNRDDAAWKAGQSMEVRAISTRLVRLEDSIGDGRIPTAESKLGDLERRVEKLEDRQEARR